MNDHLSKILIDTSLLIEKYTEISIKDGEYFNIFSIMQVQYDELFHSAFIAEFLNPSGNHKMQAVFLDLFLEKVLPNRVKGSFNFDTNSAHLIIEKNIGKKTENSGGRIDIYISDKNNKKIIIENKIFAPDQENQIERYYNYRKDKEESVIFYLTLFGTKPKKNSSKSLVADRDFFLISYQNDIVKWLSSCLSENIPPVIYETLKQYLNLIKIITNQTINDDFKMELSNIIKTNFLEAYEITRNFDSVKNDILNNFWDTIKNSVQKELDMTNDIWKVDISEIFNRKNSYFTVCKEDWIDTYIYFRGLNSRLFYGITVLEKNKLNGKEINNILRKNSDFPILKELKKTEWSVIWEYKPEFNFTDINIVSKLIDSKQLQSMVNSMTEFIVKFSLQNEKLGNQVNRILNDEENKYS